MKRLRSTKTLAPALLTLLAAGTSALAALENGSFESYPSARPIGDLRLSYNWSGTDERDGDVEEVKEGRLRLRGGADLLLARSISARVRAAGRFSTEPDFDLDIGTHEHGSGRDGLEFGQVGLDEAWVQFGRRGPWRLRAGRFQSDASLEGVAGKSLSRNDSNNTNITWTDGLRLHYRGERLRARLEAQYNPEDGTTKVLREPLEFLDDGSRIGLYGRVWAGKDLGPIIQRELDVVYLPSSLPRGDFANRSYDDYIAVTGRLAAAWELGIRKKRDMELILGGSAGFAPETPTNAALEIDADGDADGLAFQFTASLENVLPRHDVGITYAEAGAGWLVSPQVRDNTRLMEARYRYRMRGPHVLEFRLRQREDRESRIDARRDREDRDLYLRYTYEL